MREVTLYHRKASGAIKIWRCRLHGCNVQSGWMQQGGKANYTTESKSTPEKAEALFERKVLLKKRKGYETQKHRVVKTIQVDDSRLDFDRLPKCFAPAKPIKTFKPDELAALYRAGLLHIQRKRDGMRHYLVGGSDGTVRIFSSGKDELTEHLYPLIGNLVLPPYSILDVELVVTNTNPGQHDKDEFNTVASISRSKPSRARAQIAEAQKAGMRVQLFAFDVLWWEEEAVFRKPYKERYALLQEAVRYANPPGGKRGVPPSLEIMPLVTMKSGRVASFHEALDRVKEHGWEGLVVWHKGQETSVQVNGSPKRTNCWKVKPIKEEDVIATGYELGKGRNSRVVGRLNLAVRMDGHLHEMGNVGTGLDDDTREAALKWTYPCVVQIEYDQRSLTGFRFPVFIRKRDDKTPEEC